MSTVNAALPGVFYRRPAPDQEPFVEVGAMVQEGQTIALIEVMKTFSEVKAEQAGTLGRFLLDEGDEVEAGQGVAEVVAP
ncbi:MULTISPECIES: acetyl-CoA carboxylase [Saccharopolyspora]|uniref:Biotin carboxyl carrier protein of acetyl-CoA carboxylase n=1 Tax=Saccharopolyspora gregorii TaxID=33914 RepID=A0ABP6RQ02_9PSEU|nr:MULTISPECIES: acetyl-CoA carboxylase [Saccharopolyspora]MCA1186253.1 biotin carboxyl carrier domain-containing protein [Saccharopolyspora sp. 6T]MCA1192228.1 biotin carboxyl carrier domain-containing protein [Saccharopolyspora sp. 6V]MCA1227567.1 biotin carboxyl carrier domain-containing protein [Saccharopolyspora sp. 6M]MCA1281702.1 biotin carboxyl carrier domain-containing protein [Saccharopolyspora sp. 7B]